MALSCAAGERRAVLIGVQNYGASVSSIFPKLHGPENDLALMYTTLKSAFGNDMDISVLGGPSGLAPTRKAILSSLDHLADNAAAGDEVIIYLSGHGTQLPSPLPSADEPDGLDEVFLPADTTLIRTKTGYGLRNHIRDTEIGARIARMERAGSFVWLIVDSCHAGTMLRGSETELTPRMVNFQSMLGDKIEDLNPPSAADQSRYSVLDTLDGGKFSQGRFVAFYAAAPDALAFELPTGSRAETVHGLFTISLTEALSTSDSFRFSDLALETSARMWARAGLRAQAMYRGALETPLFGLRSQRTHNSGYALRFDEEGLFVHAGRLQGLVPGAKLTVQTGNGADRRPVFTAEVSQSGLDIAELDILAHTSETPNYLPEMLAQAGLPYAQFKDRWLADRAPYLTVRSIEDARLASPTVKLGTSLPPDLIQTLIQAAKLTSGRVNLSTSDADAVLDLSNDALVLSLQTLSYLSSTMPVRIGQLGMTTEDLAGKLTEVMASRALVQMATQIPENLLKDALELQIARLSMPTSVEGRTCQHLAAGRRQDVPLNARPILHSSTDLPRLLHCDQVFLTLTNHSALSLDVSPLYVSAEGSIYYLTGYPMGSTDGLRIPAGTSGHVEFTESVDPAHSGSPATLLLLAVPSTDGPARDFRYLTTTRPTKPTPNAVVQTRSVRRAANAPDLRYSARAWHFVSGNADVSRAAE